MADPFTALTVSCAALQFLDFGAKVVKQTYTVYKTGDGATRNVIELEAAAERLRDAAKANNSPPFPSGRSTPAEARMRTLCDECTAFADQLVKDLGSLKANGKPGFRSSAKMVLKTDRKKEELRFSEKRLEALRSEMNAQLLKILGKQNINPRALKLFRRLTNRRRQTGERYAYLERPPKPRHHAEGKPLS